MVQFHCCVNSVMQNSLIITGKFTRTSTLYCVVHSFIDKQHYIDNDHSKDLLQDYVVLLSLIDERIYRQCSLQGFTSRFGMLQSSWFSSWPKQKIGDKIVSETTWLQHFWLDQHHLPSLNFRWTFRLSVTLFYSTFLSCISLKE